MCMNDIVWKSRVRKILIIVTMAMVAFLYIRVYAYFPKPDHSNSDPTTEQAVPTTESTIQTEDPTVPPEYELIDLPEMIELPHIDAFKTVYEVEAMIINCDNAITEYEALLDSIPSDHMQYDDICQRKITLCSTKEAYVNLLQNHWNTREERRPIMTYIWRDLKEHGWSDEVVAGIVGNMIAESGGMGYQDIDGTACGYESDGNVYYGICQWSLMYAPQLHIGSTLDEQLYYLKSSIEKQINNVYSESFRNQFGILDLRYKDFTNIDNPYDAAIAFAVCYERCASRYVERRGPLAEKVYDYYVNLNTWPWP